MDVVALEENLKLPEQTEDKAAEGPQELVLALTSDRGLCGAVHSSIVKTIKARVADEGLDKFKFVLVGDKSKAMLQK